MNDITMCENLHWHKSKAPPSGRILRVKAQVSLSRKWCLVTQCLQSLSNPVQCECETQVGECRSVENQTSFSLSSSHTKKKRLTRTRKSQEYCVSVVYNEWGQRRRGTIEDRKWLGGTHLGEGLQRDGKSKHTASTWGGRGRLAKIFMNFKLF